MDTNWISCFKNFYGRKHLSGWLYKEKKKKPAAHGVGSCLRFDKTTKLINFIIEMENPCM